MKDSLRNENRKLGFTTIFLITLNAIFASSLTYLPGLAVQSMGAKSIIAWIIIFLIGIYIAMSLSELIMLFPKAGDLYVYAKNAYGHFIAFIVGWTSWIAGNIGASLAVVWALEYFNSSTSLVAYLIKFLIGLGIIIFVNYISFRGVSLKKVVLLGFSLITLFVLFLQIIPLFFNISILSGVNITTFSLTKFFALFTQTQTISVKVLFATIFIISEAIMGMEIITFLTEDAKSTKTIPKALVYAMSTAGIITLIYIIGSIGVLPLGKYISSSIPHKELIHLVWSNSMSSLIYIGTAIMIIAPFILWVFIGPKLLRSLGKDRLILEQLTELHHKFKTPSKGILFQTIIITAFTGFMYFLYINHHHDPYKLIHEVFVALVLFILSITLAIIPILRNKIKKQRDFKVFGGKIIPFIIIFFFISISFFFGKYSGEWHIFYKAFTLIILGIPIYFLLNIFYNPQVVRKLNDEFAFLALIFENYSMPKEIRRKIVSMFGKLEGKKIFEFGSGIGTLTLELAKEVGPSGRVETVDFSEKNVKILEKRLKKNNYSHVKTIHDPHMINRIHPEISDVDIIFSVGNIDYVQDLQKVLKEMADILPENGRICIVEYSNFFGFIPDNGWKSNLEELTKIFRRAGFSIRIVRWKSFLWDYICIYGLKTHKEIIMI